MPLSLNASSTACGEAARLCFWHCVNNPLPRPFHVFLAWSLLLFSSLLLYIFPPLFLNALGSHFAFCGKDTCLCLFDLRNKLPTFLILIFHLYNNWLFLSPCKCVAYWMCLFWELRAAEHTHTHITQNHYRAHRSGSVVQTCRRTYWPANCDLRALFLLTRSDHLHCTAGRKTWSILSLWH